MKVLITGIGGFVAPHVAREFESHGHEVWGTGLTASRDYSLPLERQVIGDLTHAGQWDRLMSKIVPDAIVHLAAQSNPARSWQIPKETFEANVLLPIDMLEAAARGVRPPRIVLISSSDVYGNPTLEELPVVESNCPRPHNPYAVSKLAAEMCCRLYAERLGLELVVLRPFSHTGQGQTPMFVVPAFARQIALIEMGKADCLTHGDLDACRDFSDVRDVARAYRMVAESDLTEGTFNVCSGRSISIREILEILRESCRREVRTKVDERLVRGDPPLPFRGSHKALKRATGWEPRHSMRETLEWVLNEQRELAKYAMERPS